MMEGFQTGGGSWSRGQGRHKMEGEQGRASILGGGREEGGLAHLPCFFFHESMGTLGQDLNRCFGLALPVGGEEGGMAF